MTASGPSKWSLRDEVTTHEYGGAFPCAEGVPHSARKDTFSVTP